MNNILLRVYYGVANEEQVIKVEGIKKYRLM